ncbi:hypothetical protein DMB38_13650 [Streptomyces sp. WAC 06738]|nr:hypothetical protein DMB38_13650 [Streptomyces sp. WAC 06738]
MASPLAIRVRYSTLRRSCVPGQGVRLSGTVGIHESPNDFPRNGEVSLTVETVVAELCANAVLHGRVPGRDFHLAMRLRVDGVLRIEVADARRERVPVLERRYDVEGERGRGLLLVEAMADRWGVAERQAVGKIVRCELDT